jgi:hypothetical protein
VRVIEDLGQFLQGLLARGPAQQSTFAIETLVGAFDRLVRRADLLLARPGSVRVGRGRLRSEGVRHDLLDAVGLDRRSPLARLRACVAAA